VQKQNGIPDPAYLAGTPQTLAFEMKTMTSTGGNRQSFTYDAQTLFDQALDTDGPSLRDSIVPADVIIARSQKSGSKRTIDVALAPEPPVPVAKTATTEPEQTPKKQRKNPKKPASAQNGRKKGGAQAENTATQNGTAQPAVVAAPVIQSPVIVCPSHNMLQTHTTNGPLNRQNVVHLVHVIRRRPEFVRLAKNPLSTVPVEIGLLPMDPQVGPVLLCLAQCCEYLGGDWMKEETEDDFFKSLFSGSGQ
jgi:hypothetical protein